MNKRSRRNIVIAMICSTFTIVMCRCYDNTLGFVTYQNDLTCQFFKDYFNSGLNLDADEGHECTYVCPNGHLVTMDFPSEKLSISKSALESEICRDAGPPATSTALPSTATATLSSGQVTTTSVPPTISPTPTLLLPLLTNQVTSCGTAGATRIIWVSFRLAEPRLDLTGRSLSVTIGTQPASCGINQNNTSILTCFLPPRITYPASVVVSLDGVEVNNFTINVSNGQCQLPVPSTSEPQAGPTTGSFPPAIPPTAIPPTAVPPTDVPPTSVPPTDIPPTTVPATPKP